MKISVVIPTLNEATAIAECLSALQPLRADCAEVIVVDGGSRDSTTTIADPLCDELITSAPGRAVQQNAGWRAADADLVLFLHADTLISTEMVRMLASSLDRQSWGFFPLQLSSDKWVFRVVEKLISWRSRVTGIAGGDQAIFVNKRLLEQVNGFPEMALMEDIELCRRLKRVQRPVICSSQVKTSSRRWHRHGFVKTILLMWSLRLSYYLGVSPARLARWYRHAR